MVFSRSARRASLRSARLTPAAAVSRASASSNRQRRRAISPRRLTSSACAGAGTGTLLQLVEQLELAFGVRVVGLVIGEVARAQRHLGQRADLLRRQLAELGAVAGDELVHPAACLGEVAAHQGRQPKRGGEPEADRAVVLDAPSQRCAEVLLLRLQASEPAPRGAALQLT